jgi:hypothetical protein
MRVQSRSLRLLSLLAAVGVGAALPVACGDDEADGSGSSSNSGGSGGSGGSGAGQSGGSGASLVTGGSGGNTLNDGEACATDEFVGEPIPVDMVIMLDQSGSMNTDIGAGQTRWEAVTTAMSSFLAQAPADLGVGLQYFPLFSTAPTMCATDAECGGGVCALQFSPPSPFCLPEPAYACTSATYQSLEVAIAIGNLAAIDASFAAHIPFAGTPTRPALEGAIAAAKAHQAANADRKAVVVLATDGLPSDHCNPNTIAAVSLAASAGLGDTPSVPTFVIGIADDPNSLANLNSIAQAGGTEQAFLVNDANATQDLIDALNSIGQKLSCELTIPEPEMGELDYGLVNVRYTTPATEPDGVYISQVPSADDCAAGGWYYDDPSMPTTIVLCPDTCADAQTTTGSKVDIILGCKTQGPN